MGTERRRQLLLAALAVALAIVIYRQWPTTAPVSNPPSNQRAAGTSGVARERTGKAAAPAETTDVHLERPKPEPTERNLFRFREKAPPPAGRGAAPPPVIAPANPEPAGPPQPPPLPPINLKCFGVVNKGASGPKIAVCTDGNGPPQSVAEGQIVLGRYRILKIGEESIEVAYADGRGRQTIRITGS